MTVSSAKYNNLGFFGDFANDKTLDDIDFLQVAYEVIKKLFHFIYKCDVILGLIIMKMRQELHIPPSPEYNNVITEMGICHSTSDLNYLQRPYRGNVSSASIPDQVPDNTLYSSVDIMRLIITPHFLDTENVTIVGIAFSGSCIF